MDSVLSVEKLASGSFEPLTPGVPGIEHGIARSVAKRAHTEQLALVLDTGPLFAEVEKLA